MSEEALEEIKYYSEMYPDGIHKKSQAKEMFKELGYEYNHYDSEEITYIKQDRQWREDGKVIISFDLLNKQVELSFQGDISRSLPVFLSVKEIQAINKQVE